MQRIKRMIDFEFKKRAFLLRYQLSRHWFAAPLFSKYVTTNEKANTQTPGIIITVNKTDKLIIFP